MDGLHVTDSWVFGVVLLFVIGFFTLSPYFGGDERIDPNFAKNCQCPRLASCRNQTAQRMKTGKYYF